MMPVDRQMLLDWLLPHCEPDTVSVMYAKARGDGPGWVNVADDVAQAITAYRASRLAGEDFASITKDGRQYTITGGTDHAGDGGNVHLADAIDRFLDAAAIRFTSKSGKGRHCFYALAEPMVVEEFFNWANAWGFNQRGDIECLPKSPKRSQMWLPNEPNESGGDVY